MNAYMKQYIIKSNYVHCPCNKIFKAYNKSSHNKSQHHIKYFESNKLIYNSESLRIISNLS